VLAQILHDPIPAPTSLHAGLDVALEAIVLHATAKEPQGRYQNARQFAEALGGWSGSAQWCGAATITAGMSPSGGRDVVEAGRPKDSATCLTPADPTRSLPVRKRRLPVALLGCLLSGLVPVGGGLVLVSILAMRGCSGAVPTSKAFRPVAPPPTRPTVDPSELLEAAEKGRLVKVQELLRWANPNAKDGHGETALMKAASRGHLPIVRELLLRQTGHVDYITAVNEQDNDGETALMKAAGNGHADVVQALLSHPGIEPSLKDDKRQTAATKAKEKGHEDIVELLKNFKK
jgi:hypothetical protein